MKKLIALLLVLVMSIGVAAAFAEEDDMVTYLDEHPEAAGYVSTWIAENGEWRIEVYDEDGGLKLMIVHNLGDGTEDIWEYAATMDTENKLAAVPLGLHYKLNTATDNWDVNYYEDGDAVFEITEDGKLNWKDLKEDAGKDLAFEKIGCFYGGEWMKGDIQVIFFDWYDGQYDIRLFQRGENNEILKDAILKGDYDAETNTVTATGEFEGEEPMTIVFSYNEEYSVVWTENGESTVLELSTIAD